MTRIGLHTPLQFTNGGTRIGLRTPLHFTNGMTRIGLHTPLQFTNGVTRIGLRILDENTQGWEDMSEVVGHGSFTSPDACCLRAQGSCSQPQHD